MVANLEQRYDSLLISGAAEEVPSAEDIAAEVEQFLADLDTPEDPQGPSAS